MNQNQPPKLDERCNVCGQTNPETLETHHVVPRRYGGSDAPENLVDLCGSCHNAIESIYDDAFYRRLNTASTLAGDRVDDRDLGHEVEPQHSPDRNFSPNAIHISHKSMFPHDLIEREIVDRDTLISAGYIEEGDNSEDGDEHKAVPLIHCGYCNTAFLPWEQADCAKHLQLAHRIGDPYEGKALSELM